MFLFKSAINLILKFTREKDDILRGRMTLLYIKYNRQKIKRKENPYMIPGNLEVAQLASKLRR